MKNKITRSFLSVLLLLILGVNFQQMSSASTSSPLVTIPLIQMNVGDNSKYIYYESQNMSLNNVEGQIIGENFIPYQNLSANDQTNRTFCYDIHEINPYTAELNYSILSYTGDQKTNLINTSASDWNSEKNETKIVDNYYSTLLSDLYVWPKSLTPNHFTDDEYLQKYLFEQKFDNFLVTLYYGLSETPSNIPIQNILPNGSIVVSNYYDLFNIKPYIEFDHKGLYFAYQIKEIFSVESGYQIDFEMKPGQQNITDIGLISGSSYFNFISLQGDIVSWITPENVIGNAIYLPITENYTSSYYNYFVTSFGYSNLYYRYLSCFPIVSISSTPESIVLFTNSSEDGRYASEVIQTNAKVPIFRFYDEPHSIANLTIKGYNDKEVTIVDEGYSGDAINLWYNSELIHESNSNSRVINITIPEPRTDEIVLEFDWLPEDFLTQYPINSEISLDVRYMKQGSPFEPDYFEPETSLFTYYGFLNKTPTVDIISDKDQDSYWSNITYTNVNVCVPPTETLSGAFNCTYIRQSIVNYTLLEDNSISSIDIQSIITLDILGVAEGIGLVKILNEYSLNYSLALMESERTVVSSTILEPEYTDLPFESEYMDLLIYGGLFLIVFVAGFLIAIIVRKKQMRDVENFGKDAGNFGGAFARGFLKGLKNDASVQTDAKKIQAVSKKGIFQTKTLLSSNIAAKEIILFKKNGDYQPLRIKCQIFEDHIQADDLYYQTSSKISNYLFGDILLMRLENNRLYPIVREKIYADAHQSSQVQNAATQLYNLYNNRIDEVKTLLDKVQDKDYVKSNLGTILSKANQLITTTGTALNQKNAFPIRHINFSTLKNEMGIYKNIHVGSPGSQNFKEKIRARVDTGAEIALISPKLATSINAKPIKYVSISGINDAETLTPVIKVSVEIENQNFTVEAAIFKNLRSVVRSDFLIDENIYDAAMQKGILFPKTR